MKVPGMISFKKLFLCSTLALGLGACASGPAKHPAQTPESDPLLAKAEVKPLIGSFRVQRFQLKNGLKLLIVEDHSSPTFAYQTWFNVGSRDEIPPRTGLAHLFEHLMFKATANHPEGEFDRILESHGVEDENAFTSWDYTAFVQELPSKASEDNLDLIASLESDRMVHLSVNPESFKTEREVVQNERRYRNENSPEGAIFQKLYEMAFTQHSYHWPIIGYEKDLNGMSAQDAMDFYHAYYSPNHATIVVVGDVKPQHVLETVEKYYGALQPQASPVHTIPVEPAQTSPRRERMPLSIQVEKLTMAYHAASVKDSDMPALLLLDSVLTGGKSSRLSRALIDTGIASGVNTSPMEQKDPSLFIFEVGLQEHRHAAQAESVIIRELKRLASEPVPASELERAKNKAQFSFYAGLDGNGDKANFLGRYETMTGDYARGLELQSQMMAVTPEQLQTVVQKYFAPRARTVVTGVMQ
jgi:zinc protease